MTVRKLEVYEYSLIKNWWLGHTGDIAPEQFLLSDFGHVALSAGKPVAAMFWFPTIGSKIAFIGWPISNPESTRDERSVALDKLMFEIERHALILGYSALTTYSSRSSVAKRFEQHGYMIGDSPVTQYIKILE